MGRKLDASQGFGLDELDSTDEVEIPGDPLARVIGQDEAISVARLAARQRRHLLLVGPPGTGKSMIAQALALHMPQPTEEIRVVHNPENPERPLVEVVDGARVLQEKEQTEGATGQIVEPREVPLPVAARLGYMCSHCETYSSFRERTCPSCTKPKVQVTPAGGNPFGDLLTGVFEMTMSQLGMGNERVTATRKKPGKEGKDEIIVYERAGEQIRVLDEDALKRRREMEKRSPHKVLVKLNRRPFVLATGASETELLGDVRHDPFGGHPQVGVPQYDRVIAGTIHDAHQGVLFIDELPHLGPLQRYILTAMQEKRFPISGRNPQSSGAAVRVDAVPCDFIFVGACNIVDLKEILSPLRSRVLGNGYELLVEMAMDDTPLNRAHLAQFIAQEIKADGKIPPMSRKAVEAIIKEASRRAKVIDNQQSALTLRLRELGGLVRAAGDAATVEGAPMIEAKHVEAGLKRARPVEEMIKEKYGSFAGGVAKDVSEAQKQQMPYYDYNVHKGDEDRSYG
ncbi:MAG TPA: ATP-binding protein [Thermoplasmata archaeon]|nr:ATP-binding protein [Thermoplasmata archaeon]